MIAKLFVIIGVVVAASAVKQGGGEGGGGGGVDDDVSLTKERKELSEERKEITEMFRRETETLRQEDEQLHAKLEELQRQNVAKLEELKRQNDKVQRQNDKRDKKQQEQITKLKKENQKLRRANSEINKVVRQRDQNDTQEFDVKIRNSLRQNDVSTEIKKMMRSEITNFLITERICVGGQISTSTGEEYSFERKVDFGYTFPRKPTFVASVGRFNNHDGELQGVYVWGSVTTTSAVILTYKKSSSYPMYFSWLACL